MTQSSLFWAGETTGDAGVYSDDQFSNFVAMFTRYRKNYNIPVLDYNAGSNTNNPLNVRENSPASLSVLVDPGNAFYFGRTYFNDDVIELAISANATSNPRIDTVVLRKDWTAQTIRVVVLTGVPGVSPVAPTLTQNEGTLYEYALADIAVAAGSSTIVNANISMRNPARQYIPSYQVEPGEIKLSGSSTTSLGYLTCDGSAVSRTDYSNLFTAIGTSFGVGDGSTTFNLPDLRGRVPMGVGTGSGLTARVLGEFVGTETHTLTIDEMPEHGHLLRDLGVAPGGGAGVRLDYDGNPNPAFNQGGSQAHNNLQPSLVVNYIIKY